MDGHVVLYLLRSIHEFVCNNQSSENDCDKYVVENKYLSVEKEDENFHIGSGRVISAVTI